jgi:predicted PurR-regulated permease PerM
MEIVQNWVNKELKKENLYYIINDFGLLNHLSVLSSKLGALLINALENSIASLFLVTSNLIKILLGLLISVYVLFDKEKLVEGSKTLIYMTIKEDKGKKLIEWVKIYHNMIGLYIGTKALDSFIIGVLAFIGLVIINAPYSALLALIVGVTNMVPYLGPLIGEVIGGIMGLFVSPMMGITVFVFLFVLQQFDAWYLDPKLIGNKVGVKPFFILIALAIGGGYFGVIGMLLASPTIATLKIAYDRKVAKFIINNGHLLKHIESNSMKSSINAIKLEDKEAEEDDETKLN